MVIKAETEILPRSATVYTTQFKPKITMFHCFNALNNTLSLGEGNCEVDAVKMPCSSMTREVFLLRAFEAGADAVVVLTCPLGTCRYGEGNIRAAKRVMRMKKLLDEIGIGGRRLNIFHVQQGDEAAVDRIIEQTVSDLSGLGPNPAK
jgi:F420-non-reducing hydrogenase iron-sulfur subunit